MGYLDDVFSPKGYLARKKPGYCFRPGQLELATRVHRSIIQRQPFIAEAPTGLGKSLAYLVPAIYSIVTQGLRVVVVTEGNTLAEQLIYQDLPFLEKALPWNFNYAIMKGRRNFVCQNKAANIGRSLNVFRSEEEKDCAIGIQDWLTRTGTGVRDEIEFQVLPSVWDQYAIGGDDCKGKHCKHLEPCYYRAARKAAFEADLIVTNYHTLGQHLRLGFQLPQFDVLICDEAHMMPDIMRDCFADAIARGSLGRISTATAAMGEASLASSIKRITQSFFQSLDDFASTVMPPSSTSSKGKTHLLTSPPTVDGSKLLKELRVAFDTARKINAPWLNKPSPENPELREKLSQATLVERWSSAAYDKLGNLLTQQDRNRAYWIERTGTQATLVSQPIGIGSELAERLFNDVPRVICLSATLTSADKTFKHFRRESGIPTSTTEHIAPSPFDTESNVLCIVPSTMPAYEYRCRDVHAAAAREHAADAVSRAKGRTLVLCAKLEDVAPMAERLRRLPYPVLAQGDAERSVLVQRFRDDIQSVLVGCSSFRSGIDVPGEALSCVVIDRMPYAQPDQPIYATLQARNGKSQAFADFSFPRAITQIQQAIGRLIRTSTDWGAVVICDRRVLSPDIRRALPPMRWSHDMAAMTLMFSFREPNTSVAKAV